MTRKEKQISKYYLQFKNGEITIRQISKKLSTEVNAIRYAFLFIDFHGLEKYSTYEYTIYDDFYKKRIIAEAINSNTPIQKITIRAGMKSTSLICKWIKDWQTKGGDSLINRKGRIPIVKAKEQKTIVTKKYKNKDFIFLETDDEVDRLRKENLRLKLELDLIKKFNVLMDEKNLKKKK